jgi:hypothetical protein
MHITGDVIQELKKFEENSFNIIFSDPPYNLGSNWYIREDGHPDIKGKHSDFMSKWDGLDAEKLESMFFDFKRVLKHGGFCVFAGQMRQAMAFQYYAIKAGFDMIEPLYSFNISNFPKSLNVSKALDREAGAEREVVGIEKRTGKEAGIYGAMEGNNSITVPATTIAKKYDGIHSSICPLKQTTECWFIFRKPFKHGTIVKDILAYESGDETITPSGLNIEKGRVGTEKNNQPSGMTRWNDYRHGKNKYPTDETISQTSGRYPAQLFLYGGIDCTADDIIDRPDILYTIGIEPDSLKYMSEPLKYIEKHLEKLNPATLLDEQSGVLTSGALKKGAIVKESENIAMSGKNYERILKRDFESSSGGCSRILHNAPFVIEEIEELIPEYQHIYYSKPSNYERNAGCDGFDEKIGGSLCGTADQSLLTGSGNIRNNLLKNNHPTLKSIRLLFLLTQLFTKVDTEKMKVLIPFSGVFSEKIAFLAHGYLDENITTIEISEDYSEIAFARQKFWTENNFFFKDEKIMQSKIKDSIENDKQHEAEGQGGLF